MARTQTPSLSIVVTCHGKCPELSILMGSLKFQEDYDFNGLNIAPEGTVELPLEVILSNDGPYEGPKFDDVKIIENPKEGGVGHHTREPGIFHATKDWIVLTNADNYYVAGWLSKLKDCMRDDVGFICWDHINSVYNFSPVTSNMVFGKIDLGCIAVRTFIAKSVGFPYRHYSGDWDYIHKCYIICRKLKMVTIHINQTLFVHN